MRADADPSWLRKTGLGVSLGLHATLPLLALLRLNELLPGGDAHVQ